MKRIQLAQLMSLKKPTNVFTDRCNDEAHVSDEIDVPDEEGVCDAWHTNEFDVLIETDETDVTELTYTSITGTTDAVAIVSYETD